jgi:hypothetical protein
MRRWRRRRNPLVAIIRRSTLPAALSAGGVSCVALGLLGSGAAYDTAGERIKGSASCAALQLRIRVGSTSCATSLPLGGVCWVDSRGGNW